METRALREKELDFGGGGGGGILGRKEAKSYLKWIHFCVRERERRGRGREIERRICGGEVRNNN